MILYRMRFLALYMNLERLESSEHLRPFLFRVVRNRCYDTLRRQGRFSVRPHWRQRLTIQLAIPRSSQITANNPMSSCTGDCSTFEVQKAIERLPEIQRQAIILYCEENLTYAQIAEAMGTDIGTIKSRIFYGRKKPAKPAQA